MPEDYQGLSREEAARRRQRYGKNILPETPPPSKFSIFVSQLKSPLVYVLLCASLLTAIIGHVSDTIVILLAVILNTVLGYVQEQKANSALKALKHYVTHSTTVIRGGIRSSIHTTQLVPGDIVIAHQGTTIPADGTILSSNRFYVNESMLTGESVAVEKKTGDPVYMGTSVSSGQAVFEISGIGSATKMGAIAEKIQQPEDDTPLQKQLKKFSAALVRIIAGLLIIMVSIGILYEFSATQLIVTAIALAVSSIPEGLLVSMTVVLAIGMQRILKRRGLVKKLAAAETLGGVSVICVDKTGTLTRGSMRVVDHIGNVQDIAAQAVLANDLDDPMMIAAFEWAKKDAEHLLAKHKKVDNIAFSPKERFSMSLHKWNRESTMLFVNGAPEILLSYTNSNETEKTNILETIDTLTRQGKRLVGFIRKELPKTTKRIHPKDATHGMTWIGMLAFVDPVREGVREAIQQAHMAGIRTLVITGDYPNTSKFVLAELGIAVSENEIMTGESLEKLMGADLKTAISTIRLFARTTPDQKLHIVSALKQKGEIVAMMGDGINDAPALHAADIGIVVDDATDVAKESADLILLDSNFSTILAAVEEGRSIFENIRKIILYLLSDAFAEIFVVLSSIILRLPIPLLALQILWINLVSDGFPNLALTIDPVRKSIMKESPRHPQERLISRWMIILISMVSTLAGLIALAVFTITYSTTGDLRLAQSFTFATLGVNSLAYVFSVRLLTTPFWRANVFENTWLIVAVLAGLSLQFVPFSTPGLRSFFGLSQLSLEQWATAIVLSFSLFMVVELLKGAYRIRQKYRT